MPIPNLAAIQTAREWLDQLDTLLRDFGVVVCQAGKPDSRHEVIERLENHLRQASQTVVPAVSAAIAADVSFTCAQVNMSLLKYTVGKDALAVVIDRFKEAKQTWEQLRALLYLEDTPLDKPKKDKRLARPRNLQELKTVQRKVQKDRKQEITQAESVRDYVEEKYSDLKLEQEIQVKTASLIRALNRYKHLLG